MNKNLFNFFYNGNICSYNDIIYIIKTKGTSITQFHLADGRILTKYISLKECKNFLPQDIFININKGILINKNHIKYINRYTYYLDNDESFDGQLRNSKLHSALASEINHME